MPNKYLLQAFIFRAGEAYNKALKNDDVHLSLFYQ